MQDDALTADDREFERTLRLLPPAADGPTVNVAAAAFAAGRSAVRRQLRIWRAATACGLLLAITLQLIPGHAPTPAALQPTLAVQSAATLTPVSSQSALLLQQSVLYQGLAGLRPTPLPDSPPPHGSGSL